MPCACCARSSLVANSLAPFASSPPSPFWLPQAGCPRHRRTCQGCPGRAGTPHGPRPPSPGAYGEAPRRPGAGAEGGWSRSRSWWRRRSRMRRAGRSRPPRAGGSSPPPTRPAAGSSAICTTVPSSDWSRSHWRRVQRRPMWRPAGATCALACPGSRRDWPTRWPNCRSSRAGSTRRRCPSTAWAGTRIPWIFHSNTSRLRAPADVCGARSAILILVGQLTLQLHSRRPARPRITGLSRSPRTSADSCWPVTGFGRWP